jgi:hypothetical protein
MAHQEVDEVESLFSTTYRSYSVADPASASERLKDMVEEVLA